MTELVARVQASANGTPRDGGVRPRADAACSSSWRGDGSGPCRGHGDGSGKRGRRRRHLREQPPAPAPARKWVTGEGPPPPLTLAGKAATKQAADLRGEGGGSPRHTQTETEAGSCGRMTTPMKRTERWSGVESRRPALGSFPVVPSPLSPTNLSLFSF